MLHRFWSKRFLPSFKVSSCTFAAWTFLSTSATTHAFLESAVSFPPGSTYCSSSSSSSLKMSTSADISTLTVAQFGCLRDNYGYLIHDPATGITAAVDTPEAAPYKRELEQRGWKLTHILNTHHHHDHTGGNLELKDNGVVVIGPKNEKVGIPGIDKPVVGGDSFQLCSHQLQVLDAGGHTKGHIAYYFPDQSKVFVGDCLFTLGCGRMFEGTKEQFWASLERLRNLPDDTLVYCAHEYTKSNAKFAMSVEPNNPDLVAQVAIIDAKRQRGEPTVPSLIGEEKKANPFFRADISEEIRSNVGITANDSPADAFGMVRKAKDNF